MVITQDLRLPVMEGLALVLSHPAQATLGAFIVYMVHIVSLFNS
jgi:hypothetical protein